MVIKSSPYLWCCDHVASRETDRGIVTTLARDEDDHPHPVSAVHLRTGGEVREDKGSPTASSSQLWGRREERQLGQLWQWDATTSTTSTWGKHSQSSHHSLHSLVCWSCLCRHTNLLLLLQIQVQWYRRRCSRSCKSRNMWSMRSRPRAEAAQQ